MNNLPVMSPCEDPVAVTCALVWNLLDLPIPHVYTTELELESEKLEQTLVNISGSIQEQNNYSW